MRWSRALCANTCADGGEGRGGDGGDDAGRDGGGDARFGLVTAETRADSDDCWCVTPSGRFVGSVMRETRERLGLQSVEDERGKATVSVNLKRGRVSSVELVSRSRGRVRANVRGGSG